ncbi:Peptidase propeptide and YPEB domain protein [Streptomyces sp. ADI96-02]|uniref:PepSY domain-containing protein n=1 Tax=Streptomyces sp. ADI96-02 TaxID=1522760 RepID=UPI000F54F520|nr:PepSY domain-containing protein [Streptomyces sp. ADI96-02]RPK57765.1 Peptidase propeptide and YPEB domain protein [Streptomyces sp. ADI96-02]
MKRNITIATVTAAVLIGGTAASTVAFAGDDRDRTSARSASADVPARVSGGEDRAVKDSAAVAPGTGVPLDQALAAALRSVPGTATGAELDDDDDDGGRAVWKFEVYGSDKVWHDVVVDAGSGEVVPDRDGDDRDDDRDRGAPRSAAVSLNDARDAALKSAPGSVTSIDLDDDDDDGRQDGVLRWDVDIAGKDGSRHELRVDAQTGAVTADRDDDRDDRDDRADDRHDDRDDRDDR